MYEFPWKDIHKCQALPVSEANSLSESVPTWRENTGLGRDVQYFCLHLVIFAQNPFPCNYMFSFSIVINNLIKIDVYLF